MITDDSDTICFMQYLLHNKVKAQVAEDFRYDEMQSFLKVSQARSQVNKKVDVLLQIREQRRREMEQCRIEREVIREAFEARIDNMDQLVESSTLINQINEANGCDLQKILVLKDTEEMHHSADAASQSQQTAGTFNETTFEN